MKKQITSWSFLALLFSIVCVLVFRISNVSEKETSWDVLGYYLPLPATFIYDDPLMENRQWIEEINNEKQLTGTLYQISTNDQGEPMYFFFLGMAMLYLPFFLMGHGWANLSGYPPDGFSMPYQYALVFGAIIYTTIGLIYLRKVLLHFLPDKLTGLIILIIVFGTNYSHHLTLKNLETVNVLFMFVTLIIWNTIRWHTHNKIKNLIAIGVFITLMSMVKPSEVFVVFIPLFWGVYSWKTFKEKLGIIWNYKLQFIVAILACLLVALPQMSYWYIRTGHLFYDSYKNPGVGLDVFSPYILESLFSYKKGWLVYTPVMLLSILGMYYFVRKEKKTRVSFLLYFSLSFYIIVSWTEWWYGAAFSNRPLITVYPILAIFIGYFLLEIKSKWAKIGIGMFIVGCVFLNQFQWWQMINGILEPYRTTKEYYWATFLATKVSEKEKEKLSVYRDFNEGYEFKNEEDYFLAKTYVVNYDTVASEFVNKDSAGNSFSRFDSSREYSETFEKPYKEITNKSHIWVKVKVDIKQRDYLSAQKPHLVISMERKEGSYGYFAPQLEGKSNGNWRTYSIEYMTPNLRNSSDRLKIFVWNKEKSNFDLDNITIEIFERKN